MRFFKTTIFILCNIIIFSCRKDDNLGTPIKPEDAVMSFGFAEENLNKNILLTSLTLSKNNLTQLNLTANKELNSLWIYKNKINTLVLPASFPNLYRVECFSNNLNTAQMDALSNTFSPATPSKSSYFACIDKKDPDEQNVIPIATVNKIKAKGWKVYNINGESHPSKWLPYIGS